MKVTKQQFLTELRKKLSGLPQQDIDERLSFYSEMIEDRIEEGLTEKEAILDIGEVEDVAAQIIADMPLLKIVKERIKPKRRLKAWEIVLLALGSPIWISLLVAVFAVMLSVYVVLWAVDVSIWAIFVAVVACAPCGVLIGIVFLCTGGALTGVAMIGAGILCAGLAIFLFFACKAATKGIFLLTLKLLFSYKNLFLKKEKN